MTISTTTRTKQYNGDNSTTVFAYDFNIQADSELEVYLGTPVGAPTTWTKKTLTTHYLIDGAGTAGGGNVTFTSGNTPPTGTGNIFIRRVTPKTQSTDYVENDPFPANAQENALDKITQITQDMQEEIDRCFKLGSIVPDAGVTEASSVVADRANKLFAFDASGDFSVAQEIGTFQGNWAASTAYVVRDLVKDTSNNNIYICITAHTSSGSQPLSSNTDSAKWSLIVDAASATSASSSASSSASAAATSATNAAASEANALTYKNAAETAKTASETAQTASEAAKTASETAQAASEAAKTSAEGAVGAVAWKYNFDNSTTMADPGTGDIRFDNATLGSITNIAIDATSADTGNPDVSDLIASIDDGTNSTHEGYIFVRKSGTPATFIAFNVTGAISDNTGWLQIPVTTAASNGSLSASDTLYVSFARSGNVGAQGIQGIQGNVGPQGPAGDVDNVLTTQGDIVFRNATESARLGAGTSGYFLKTQGSGANPVWAEVVSGGPSLGSGNEIIRTNSKSITSSITFAGTENGMSAGPISISGAGVSVTVTSGSTWTIV